MMDDNEIIRLYHAREERAIEETDKKYGSYCHRIALNLLNVQEDAKECVNDTYLAAWRKMPPEWPHSLKSFLGRIVRNLSVSRYRQLHAKKRGDGMEQLLSELNDCVPSSFDVEKEMEKKELSELISNWLDGLVPLERALFVRRYWYGDSIADLARENGCFPAQMTQRMLRLRKKLKTYLEKEGVVI